jgi:uncharacterized protein YjbJ (UPF0337 family)
LGTLRIEARRKISAAFGPAPDVARRMLFSQPGARSFPAVAHIPQRTGRRRMNRDIAAGKWQQVRGKVKEQWGKLTDDDLKMAEGKFEKLSGLIRERYGYSKEMAERELDEFYKRVIHLMDEPAAPRR